MSIACPSVTGAETPDAPEALRAAGGPDGAPTGLREGAARADPRRRLGGLGRVAARANARAPMPSAVGLRLLDTVCRYCIRKRAPSDNARDCAFSAANPHCTGVT